MDHFEITPDQEKKFRNLKSQVLKLMSRKVILLDENLFLGKKGDWSYFHDNSAYDVPGESLQELVTHLRCHYTSKSKEEILEFILNNLERIAKRLIENRRQGEY